MAAQDAEADISDIAEVIRRDVSLSYRILKVVNSAQYSLARPLGSIEEAVMLIGTMRIVEWVHDEHGNAQRQAE